MWTIDMGVASNGVTLMMSPLKRSPLGVTRVYVGHDQGPGYLPPYEWLRKEWAEFRWLGVARLLTGEEDPEFEVIDRTDGESEVFYRRER